MNSQDLIKELEGILLKEIKKIPRPFGIFLSGGIDSAILAALAKPDFAITCNFPLGEKYDEVKYAKLVAKKLNISLAVIQPPKETFVSDLETALGIIGKPINSFSIVPWYHLMRNATGATMLNGEGADELFGGYSRYLILNHLFQMYDKPELIDYHPTLDFLLDGVHSKLIERNAPQTINLHEVMEFEYNNSLPDIIYMEKKLAKHFNVNFKQPFMSKAVKKFADKLPLKYKVKGFTSKWLLRKLASKYFPPRITGRKTKKGLIAPVNLWMGFDGARGEFDKVQYINYQREFLKEYETKN